MGPSAPRTALAPAPLLRRDPDRLPARAAHPEEAGPALVIGGRRRPRGLTPRADGPGAGWLRAPRGVSPRRAPPAAGRWAKRARMLRPRPSGWLRKIPGRVRRVGPGGPRTAGSCPCSLHGPRVNAGQAFGRGLAARSLSPGWHLAAGGAHQDQPRRDDPPGPQPSANGDSPGEGLARSLGDPPIAATGERRPRSPRIPARAQPPGAAGTGLVGSLGCREHPGEPGQSPTWPGCIGQNGAYSAGMGPHLGGEGGPVPERAPAGPLSGRRHTGSADLCWGSADGPRLSCEFSPFPTAIGGEAPTGAAPAFRSGVAQGPMRQP